MVFEAIPFPFDALVFMLPKGTVRHPTEGDCPSLVLSRTSKGQTLSLSIPGLDLKVTAERCCREMAANRPRATLLLLLNQLAARERRLDHVTRSDFTQRVEVDFVGC